MAVEEPERERGVPTHDVLPPLRLRREYAGDIVFAPGEVEHHSIAKDESKREPRLRTGAIVVVSVARALDAARCAVAGATESGTLKRYVLRQPCLPGGAE